MSELKYCQGPECHMHKTKDRIKGTKGSKTYQTRRRSNFYYAQGNFCSLRCQDDWFRTFGSRAVDHFGRLREPKRVDCDNAWYKDYNYRYSGDGHRSNRNSPSHYFVNDLLGKRIPITEQQYDDVNYKLPLNIS